MVKPKGEREVRTPNNVQNDASIAVQQLKNAADMTLSYEIKSTSSASRAGQQEDQHSRNVTKCPSEQNHSASHNHTNITELPVELLSRIFEEVDIVNGGGRLGLSMAPLAATCRKFSDVGFGIYLAKCHEHCVRGQMIPPTYRDTEKLIWDLYLNKAFGEEHR